MGLRDWFSGRAAAPSGGRAPKGGRWDGTSGRPRSSNGASSFHLFWEAPAGAWTAVEATLEVIEPPAVPELYFWALQAGFADHGREAGAGHLGLQWFPPHPGSTAVNWGGYDAAGRELSGSESALPSAPGNPNTRDFAWRPRTPYRLRISQAAPGRWRGTVTDLATGEETVVRELRGGGDALVRPMVWSEVFADCDDPTVVARWSDLAVVDAARRRVPVLAARVNYQTLGDGGCATSTIDVEGDSFVQRTNTARTTPGGSRLQLGSRS